MYPAEDIGYFGKKKLGFSDQQNRLNHFCSELLQSTWGRFITPWRLFEDGTRSMLCETHEPVCQVFSFVAVLRLYRGRKLHERGES